MGKATEKIEHRIIDPKQCPRCGSTNTDSLGSDDDSYDRRVCLTCAAKDPDGLNEYDVVYSISLASVQWPIDDGTDMGDAKEVYDSRYIAELAAQDMLRALFMLDRVDRGGQVPWVHNAGITYDIEALRRICLAYCRIWNDEIVPVLQKATGMENPIAKITLQERLPNMTHADASSFVKEYEPLAKLAGDAEIVKALHMGHDWTQTGAKTLLKLAKQYGAFILCNALALAIALDIEDGSKGL